MEEHSLMELRKQIPSYSDVQKALHDYLIDRSIQRLHINPATFLESIEYVAINAATCSTVSKGTATRETRLETKTNRRLRSSSSASTTMI